MTEEEERGHPKLQDIRLLMQKWQRGLAVYFVLIVAALGLTAWSLYKDGTQLLGYAGLLGAALTAALGFLGILFSKYGDIFKHYIDTKNAIIDHQTSVRKRLEAFHAEIRGNLIALAENYAPDERRRLTQLVLNDPHGQRFGSGDFSNPIFADNHVHLYEFSRDLIEAITDYYHLDDGLNQLVEELKSDKYQTLKTSQKISHYFYMLRVVNKVAAAGQMAMSLIEREIGKDEASTTHRKLTFPKYEKEPDLRWTEVTDDEYDEILDAIRQWKTAEGLPAGPRNKGKPVKRSE